MSPTALLLSAGALPAADPVPAVRGRVYPGYGTGWVGREGYTGYQPSTLPDPIFNIF